MMSAVLLSQHLSRFAKSFGTGLVLLHLGGSALATVVTNKHPLRVYILAGQSNMQGHANVTTLDSMAADRATAPLLKEIRDETGKPIVWDKIWISSIGCAGNGYSDLIEQTGKLTTGFGASQEEIGPELMFGITMNKALNEPILLIKTAWGGRSLITDFRPPSGGSRKFSDYIKDRWKERKLDPDQEVAKISSASGVFYHHMIDHIRMVLGDIKRVDPDYDPKQGYKLSGFVWFQGFNDMIDEWSYHDRMQPGGYAEYRELMADLIRDVRKDLNAPKLPFVIGVMGIDGLKGDSKPPMSNFRIAQSAPALSPEFKKNVLAVPTAPYWDEDLDALQQRKERLNSKLDRDFRKRPDLSQEGREELRARAFRSEFSTEELERMKGISNGGYHYLGAAKILEPIGKAFAEAMLKLEGVRKD